MSRTLAQQQQAKTIRLVAVPSEHGAWGFMLEPVLLGLLVAPSIAGLWLALATLAVFLVRQPLKLAVTDLKKHKRYPRTAWAERFAGFYLLVALLSLAAAIMTARGAFWLPILMAVPIALLQAYFDTRHQSRQVAAELAGAVAMGAAASTIALAGGWEIGPALALWVILAMRSVSSIIYVRARLRLERGERVDLTPTYATNLLGLTAVIALAFWRIAPWLAVVIVAILVARAFWGISPWRRRVRAQVVGFQELAYGVSMVLLVALGYAVHI